MADFLRNFRLRGLLDPTPAPLSPWSVDTKGIFDQPIMPKPGAEPANPFNVPDSNLAALRKRARPMMDQYASMLQSEPNREDHQLSKIGKALAAASGILTGTMQGAGTGINTFKTLSDEPFNRAKADYGSKGARLKELAAVEDARITDEEKLEVKIAEDEAKRRDDFRQWMVAKSGMDLSTARIKEIEKRMETMGLSWGTNQLTGQREILDIATGSAVPVGQILETPGQKTDREFKDFERRLGKTTAAEERMEGIRHGNRVTLQNMNNHHDEVMEGLRSSNDEAQIRLRSNLDKVSPTQRNAAFDGAYNQVLTLYPDMKDMLFTTNDDGSLKLKKAPLDDDGKPLDKITTEHYNPQVYNMFTRAVQEQMRQNLGEPSSGFQGNVPAASPTTSSAPADPALRAQAMAWLRTNKDEDGKPYDASDENIAELISQAQKDPSLLQELSGAMPANTMPQVALPQQAMPPVSLPQNTVPQQGMFSNFGQPINPNANYGGAPTFSDLMKNIRGIPESIYGPVSRGPR